MLVQNGVVGDSRVQKQAESAADAGWDVVLLGRSRRRGEERWALGGAQVRLLPVKATRQPYEVRGGWLRAPLAYSPGPRRNQRERQRRAWHASIAEIKARQALEGRDQNALARAVRKLALLPRRVAVKIAGKWIRLRIRQSDRLRDGRSEMDSVLDRFTNRFWARTMGHRVWRRFDPGLWELEIAFGKVIDALEPDLIHANDFQMLGVGARAVMRQRARGRNVKLVWDAHEYLPGMKPWVKNPRWHPAQVAHELEYASYADAVTTVSESVAELLRERHGLAELPTVVMNVPDADGCQGEEENVPDLRASCGLSPEVPLMVYSGAAAPQRGLADMVAALPYLDGVHCALVVGKPESKFPKELVAQAQELGVADRLHVIPYVPHGQVVPFLSSADIGVIPLHHYMNHEIALITKFFEYSHARLPIVVTDVEAMGGMVRATRQGEVCRAEDPEDLARAAKAILGDPKAYRSVYEAGLLDEWTWRAQADRLHSVYRRLLDGQS
ncbi:glycosyltransferase family 4 protein [Glycomyces sp. L485]|uniref:glycosyltransferase family 4 protein n=1 Tax=Glycomyces sp. L485 TaxID=2909235 RepID=UPI001F4A0F32|nr:glycosyltransferase family 4 protein [Glycomyces sp. L485]MCH7232102.1 glycosyltransferase family 4 protein [Glycomyces sp. L485]